MAKNILLHDKDDSSSGGGKKAKRTSKAKKGVKRGAKAPKPRFSLPSFQALDNVKAFWADERTRTISGLIALTTALIFTLSIFSAFGSGDQDIRLIQLGADADPLEAFHNIVGGLGAYIGYFFARQGLGLGALAIPFMLTLLGVKWLTDKDLLPLGKSFRLALALALILPCQLALITPSVSVDGEPQFSWLNDHIVGAAGIWSMQVMRHVLRAMAPVPLFVALLIMWAYNHFESFAKMRERLSSWMRAPKDTMRAEDEADEAAVKQDAASREGQAPEASASERPMSATNILLAKDKAKEEAEAAQAADDGEDVPFEVTLPPEPEPQPEEVAPVVAADKDEHAENTEDQVAFEVKEAQDEEVLTKAQLDDLTQEFGPFDPTLDLPKFQLPNIDKLADHGDGKHRVTAEELDVNKDNIIRTLQNFKIEVDRISAEVGPTVTLYEIVPAPGVRISKIKNLEDDIALSLAALGIRIIAPIPGKGTIGIEVPNSNPDVVSMRTLIASEKFQNSDAELPIALGKTISNETYVFDMAKMPHLLMAGATGQGKSVGLNAMLVSMLYRRHPSTLKFVLVDPKKVELTLYNKIVRHYLAQLPDSEDPIITDTSKVVSTLNSLCVEMDQRYELLKAAQCRNIKEYNAKFAKRKIIPGLADGHPDNGKDIHRLGHHYMPYIVLVVDEFADLIMTAGKEVETPIARLAQLARAIGIHLIIATQRPSVNIITGTIKANFPARVAFRVTSKIDSRTILDAGGADQLIGRGDLLMSTGNDLIRLQCGFVDTPEVEKICEFVGSQQGFAQSYELPPPPAEASESSGGIDQEDRDPMFEDAARVLVMHQQGSTSLLQRKLKLGYNRAGRLIDQLEAAGIIGPFEGSKARKVLVPDEASLEQLLQSSSTTTE
ncbi:MAG: DNA translocase FtsK 4TM domain-containing protein [Bacteroidota bacterium]|nr:DNA translocase FtsK 4TM domain-containing protein [Bacteroidota bacterium]